MEKAEYAIFTNMCMISDGQGNLLVQDRKNPNWPGITFPGGHVEPGESFVASVIREVKEETGLDIENPVLCGIKQFQNRSGARYVVLFYKTDKFHGQLQPSEEGDVYWVGREEFPTLQLAPDMLDMLKIMESDDLSEFYYYKEDGSWKLSLL